MDSLALKELDNLDLIFHFGRGETLESDQFMSRDPWTGTRLGASQESM
jgi:hypothetical protein